MKPKQTNLITPPCSGTASLEGSTLPIANALGNEVEQRVSDGISLGPSFTNPPVLSIPRMIQLRIEELHSHNYLILTQLITG